MIELFVATDMYMQEPGTNLIGVFSTFDKAEQAIRNYDEKNSIKLKIEETFKDKVWRLFDEYGYLLFSIEKTVVDVIV